LQRHRELVQTRDSHRCGETTAYRVLLRGDGRINPHDEHPPDGGAIDGATGFDG
jgi:hypothetical protein